VDDSTEDAVSGAQRLQVDPATCTAADLATAGAWLTNGGIVAFPTDTLYGLAVNVRDAAAVRRLFDLKGRSARAALPLIAASTAQVVAATGALTAREAILASTFWPGPLSVVRDAPAWMPAEVHGGHRTVAIRVPNHRVARSLAEAFGGLIAATSANRSGEPPAAAAADLGAIGDDARVLVIDGGATHGGAPSTLVDVRGSQPVCLREGAVTWDRVLNSLHP
jgi:L-threonylcarbamoyladenylate synthase